MPSCDISTFLNSLTCNCTLCIRSNRFTCGQSNLEGTIHMRTRFLVMHEPVFIEQWEIEFKEKLNFFCK